MLTQSLYLANYDVIKEIVTSRDNLEQSLVTKQFLCTSISIISISYLCIETTNIKNVHVSQLICTLLYNIDNRHMQKNVYNTFKRKEQPLAYNCEFKPAVSFFYQ